MTGHALGKVILATEGKLAFSTVGNNLGKRASQAKETEKGEGWGDVYNLDFQHKLSGPFLG